MLIQPPLRQVRTWAFDSRRWLGYHPRPGDIVIATYPKCGTTWMQRIVSLLVFQSPEPLPLMQVSSWLDRRFGPSLEATLEVIEAQAHRRFLKSHLPYDALPIHDEVRYIHVARDGRDACMSLHNHVNGFSPEMQEALDRIGMEDETIGRPYPAIKADPADFFHQWITTGESPGERDGSPGTSYFALEGSWWEARRQPNVLLVHYNDLKADLAGEMARIAAFLEIDVEPSLWPALVEAAGFEAMRRDGDALMSNMRKVFRHGSEGFFFKGTNQRWRDVVSEEDLALYDARIRETLAPDCAEWLAAGRRAA